MIFGADSFWQGVDVPGEALSNVIITRLPFSVPSHPLLEARLEDIRRRGGSPFVEYQVPEAVIKLKQGFGRLIRTKTDRGIVVILDPRVLTKPYGRTFLDSLPDARGSWRLLSFAIRTIESSKSAKRLTHRPVSRDGDRQQRAQSSWIASFSAQSFMVVATVNLWARLLISPNP